MSSGTGRTVRHGCFTRSRERNSCGFCNYSLRFRLIRCRFQISLSRLPCPPPNILRAGVKGATRPPPFPRSIVAVVGRGGATKLGLAHGRPCSPFDQYNGAAEPIMLIVSRDVPVGDESAWCCWLYLGLEVRKWCSDLCYQPCL